MTPAAEAQLWQDTFAAMGTVVDVVVRTYERPLAAFASVRAWFLTVESRLSRFRPESALSRLNRGEEVEDWFLAETVRLGVAAWEATDGLVNPLVGAALETVGYDRAFEPGKERGWLRGAPVPAPSDAVVVEGTRVRLRDGRLDLGGLAKGWAVDRAVQLLAREYPDCLVNAGGDIRAAGGERPGEVGWTLAVEGPDGALLWQGVWEGAVATSSVVRRRWRTRDGGIAHHLIDPRTGLPARTPYLQVSVAARECLPAEVWSKAILIGGPETYERARESQLGVLALRTDATVERTGLFAERS